MTGIRVETENPPFKDERRVPVLSAVVLCSVFCVSLETIARSIYPADRASFLFMFRRHPRDSVVTCYRRGLLDSLGAVPGEPKSPHPLLLLRCVQQEKDLLFPSWYNGCCLWRALIPGPLAAV